MGAYRSSPLKNKYPVLGENKRLSFCANGMCGTTLIRMAYRYGRCSCR